MAPRIDGAVFRTYRNCGRFSMIPEYMMRRKDVTASAKLVYGYLVKCEGKSGLAFPSHKAIAEAVGLSDRQVRKCLIALRDMGVLRITERKTRDGQTSNLYEFIWRDWMAGVELEGHGGRNESSYEREPSNENTATNTVLEPLPPIAAQSAPVDPGRVTLRAVIRRRSGHTITDGQIDSMIVRATVKCGSPVTASECAAVAQVLPLPSGRAKAIQSPAWWVSSVANAFGEVRASGENYRPEDFMPSPAYEHGGDFAELLEDAYPIGLVS